MKGQDESPDKNEGTKKERKKHKIYEHWREKLAKRNFRQVVDRTMEDGTLLIQWPNFTSYTGGHGKGTERRIKKDKDGNKMVDPVAQRLEGEVKGLLKKLGRPISEPNVWEKKKKGKVEGVIIRGDSCTVNINNMDDARIVLEFLQSEGFISRPTKLGEQTEWEQEPLIGAPSNIIEATHLSAIMNGEMSYNDISQKWQCIDSNEDLVNDISKRVIDVVIEAVNHRLGKELEEYYMSQMDAKTIEDLKWKDLRENAWKWDERIYWNKIGEDLQDKLKKLDELEQTQGRAEEITYEIMEIEKKLKEYLKCSQERNISINTDIVDQVNRRIEEEKKKLGFTKTLELNESEEKIVEEDQYRKQLFQEADHQDEEDNQVADHIVVSSTPLADRVRFTVSVMTDKEQSCGSFEFSLRRMTDPVAIESIRALVFEQGRNKQRTCSLEEGP